MSHNGAPVFKFLWIVATAATLSNCVTAEQNLKNQYNQKVDNCQSVYPLAQTKYAVARAQCLNTAMEILRQTMPYPDLLVSLQAQNLAVAERVQAGRLTPTEGQALMAQRWSESVSEQQRRTIGQRSVIAQENVAQAARQQASQAGRVRTSCRWLAGQLDCD